MSRIIKITEEELEDVKQEYEYLDENPEASFFVIVKEVRKLKKQKVVQEARTHFALNAFVVVVGLLMIAAYEFGGPSMPWVLVFAWSLFTLYYYWQYRAIKEIHR